MHGRNFIDHSMLFTPGAKELVTLQLFKSYCLRFMLYNEVMPLSKHLLNTLDSCVSQAVAKISNTYDKDSINQIRLVCDLPV